MQHESVKLITDHANSTIAEAGAAPALGARVRLSALLMTVGYMCVHVSGD